SWSKWKPTIVTVVLTFLCNIESSMLAMGEWPYMSTIDHEATANFYGTASAVNKAAHVIFTFLFAFWAYSISGMRIPMLVGRCITLVSCVMYIFVEFIPSNRRWWMLFCYLLFGIGFGTSPLLRSYIARVTSEENRSSAYALQNGAVVLSVMVGPIAQIAFSGLPYPGVDIIPPHLKLNVYSAPIWFAVITNILAILITIFLLKDVEEIEEIKNSSSFKFSLAAVRDQWTRVRSLNLPWILIVLVIFEKMVSTLFNSTMGSVVGPMFTAMYAMDGLEIIMWLGIAQVVVGLLAVSFSMIFFVFKLGNHVSCRVLFVFSNVIVILSYLISYPFPFDSNPLKPFNETTRTGCDPAEYKWCDSQLVMNIIPFLIALIITMSFAIPATMMSLDTIYSKIVGNIDQNVFQSIFVIAEDIMAIVGPIYGSAVFTAIGINYINIINGLVYIVTTLVWLAAWKWLAPY
ncbi:hypothetical protein PMAYCL1PPCAC_17388, partial [Pristionchus mayeri]